ncbi:uncharacterized protein LOC127869546 isoform X2 [Dreissena polymorpha]|uniref:uncharacterized protein LOC127869546 isoform X2 n=1 Tax=Dreissena polymorpha TaxID=45954 RepID=UPI00226514EA|nr:uncharacterized protein LOC127869546 isoform X2 [Dreissena polymorpha]
MGNGVSQPVNCQLEWRGNVSKLAIKESRLSRQSHDPAVSEEWRDSTIVSTQPVSIDGEGSCIRISVDSGSVLRIGLTKNDPNTDANFLESSVFEKEDGFGMNPETRKLYIEKSYNLLYFGKEDNLREYECDMSDTLWFYVITIYGSPNIAVNKEDGTSTVQMTRLRNNGIAPDLETCKTKEPLVRNIVYYIKWSMSLKNDTVAAKPPEHGLLRIALVSQDNTIKWESTSAVFDQWFNGIIAIKLNDSGLVEHNLLVRPNMSSLQVNSKLPNETSVYLRTDFSCGQIEIDKMSGKTAVKQQNGSIMLLELSQIPQNELYLKQDIVKTCAELVRLDFGCNPMKCVAQFRTVLPPTGRAGLMGSLCSKTEVLKETKLAQVFVPRTLERNDIEEYFTRENVGGGECTIHKLPDEDDDESCWLITFTEDRLARDIWLRGLHIINKHVAHVLPFYNELGRAEKSKNGEYGRLPSDKNEKIKMAINDESKFRFVSQESQRGKFIQYVQSKVNVTIKWCGEESEFQDVSGTSTVKNYLEIECEIPHENTRMRDNWQTSARLAVKQYFDIQIQKEIVDIEPGTWESIGSYIENERRSSNLYIAHNKENCSIVIVGEMDDANMERIVKKIRGGDTLISQKEIEVDIKKFMCLKEEGVIADILGDFPTVSIITKDAAIQLKGERNDVNEAQKRIFTCTANIRTISVKIDSSFTQLFLSSTGKNCLKQCLSKIKLNSNFLIPPHSDCIVIPTYCNAENKDKDKESLLKKTIAAEFSTHTVQVNDVDFTTLSPESWTSLTNGILRKVPVHVSYQPHSNQISLIGSKEHLQEVKETIDNFLKTGADGKKIIFIPPTFAEYLDSFEQNKFQNRNTFVIASFSRRDKSEYTGKLELTGVLSSVQNAEDIIAKEIKHIGLNWFHISRKWIASVVGSLPIKLLQQECNCLVQADTAVSLAANNISSISINKNSGGVIQVKVTDVSMEVVDVMCCPNDSEMMFGGVVSKQIDSFGGTNIKKECRNHVEQNGPVERSNVIESTPGNLHCITIVHAVTPKWIDGSSNEESLLKKTVLAILKVAHDRCLISVALPPLWCDSGDYPPQSGAQHVVESVSEFMDKYPKSSVKEIFLCVKSTEDLENYHSSMHTLKGHWYTFEHKRLLCKGPQQKSAISPSFSGSDLSLHKLAESSLFWKHKRKNIPTRTVRWQIPQLGSNALQDVHEEQSDGDNNDSNERLKEDEKSVYDGGLPYKIQLTQGTTLRIMTGDITLQKTDVIVNVSQTYPAITGKLSRDIVEQGRLNDEWDQLKCLNIKEVKSTSKGTGVLNCKRVYHVIGPSKTLTEFSNIDAIRSIITACLNKASNDGYESISFPTINQGQLRDDKVAETMVQTIHQYVTASKCSLKNVEIVIFYNDDYVAKVFEQEVPSLLQFDSPSPKQESNTKVKVPTRRTAVYVEPKTLEHTPEDDVAVFRVVSKCSAEEIKKKIIAFLEEEIITIDFDLTIGNEKYISQKEETCLKSLVKKHIVDVNIDKVACKLQVTGPRLRVGECKIDLIQMVFMDFPLWRHKDNLAEYVSRHVQWYYEDVGMKRAHDQSSNLHLQQGFAKGKDFTYFNQLKGEKYSVDVKMQRECPESNPGQYRQIYQRFIASTEIELPENWTVRHKGEPAMAKVQLNHTDQEYGEVKVKLLKDGLQPKNIINIFRLEHRYMWMTYQAKKQHIESQNPRGVQNERLLWHGTDSVTIDLIVRGGYNRSFFGKNATAYGNGAYFATTSRYSNNYAKVDASGVSRMFLNKVLTGEYTAGASGMSCLPQKTILHGIPVLFDSAVDHVGNPTMFVIFHDSQVYPEYLIEYN